MEEVKEQESLLGVFVYTSVKESEKHRNMERNTEVMWLVCMVSAGLCSKIEC